MTAIDRPHALGGPSERAAGLGAAPAALRTIIRIASENWREGGVVFVTPNGAEIPVRGTEPGPEARLVVRDYRFVGRVFAGGATGFAEGYMAGEWDTPDLGALLHAFSLNFDRIAKLVEGNALVRMFDVVRHKLRRNSRAGSKRNIHAHYDLGNSFYQLWLDPSMTYSSALYERPGQPLSEAQRNKYAALARGMDLQTGQSVLEIGCGWGGFAEFAAGEIGAKVTGITISQAQYDFARKRLFEAGLAERADIRLIDYRDVSGAFDRVASIEMFEAVGEEYWPTYFGKVHDRLAPGGRAGLQIITIQEALFEGYRSNADFIQKYIFPGGMLPSEARLKAQTDRANLAWQGVIRFGQDYADTLAAWLRNFDAAWEDIRPLGFDERFRRLWRYYLAYCEAGFRSARTDVIQLTLSRT